VDEFINPASLVAGLSTRREFLAQTAAIGAMTAVASSAPARSRVTASAPETSMKTYRIPNTDLTVSRIGYGCNRLVMNDQDPHAPDVLANAAKLVRTAREQGITLFDMAAMYSGGKVETVFGELLKRSPGLRDQVIVQTKCGAVDNPHWKKKGDPAFSFDCSHDSILKSVEGSLSRLGTDRIDILLLHWPDMLVRPEEVAQAFERLHREGKVRYFGVSNHTPGQIALLKKHVSQPFVANQIRLGLADSYPITAGIEEFRRWGSAMPEPHSSLGGLLDYCRLNDIQLQAYGPISGVLRQKLLQPPADADPRLRAASQLLLETSRQKNTTPAALAMAWLLHHPANILPLTGASDPEHIVENCLADRLTLDRDQWFALLFGVAAVQAPKAT
jgi:predicted oxidoreductase